MIQSKVSEVMTAAVKSCPFTGSVNDAAQIMWENDCGCVPIVDEQAHVVGIVTDRDLAMATYTQGRPLFDIVIEPMMSKKVITCGPVDSVSVALKLMRGQHRSLVLPIAFVRPAMLVIESSSERPCVQLETSRILEVSYGGKRFFPR